VRIRRLPLYAMWPAAIRAVVPRHHGVRGSRTDTGLRNVRLSQRCAQGLAMLYLLLGLALFFATHALPMVPPWREKARRFVSEKAYQPVFSLLSAAALILAFVGYGQVRWQARLDPQLWTPPVGLRHVTFLLMLPAMVLLVAAYVPSRIRSAVQHPLLAAVVLWAFAHLLVNGDLASVIVFGSFLAWAVIDRISVGWRHALGPLGARGGGLAGDMIALVGGVAVYLVMIFWGHSWLIGVPLVP
jgi:uncharacterized membrane protein